MLAKQLTGSWILTEMEYRFKDGEVVRPFGENPVGIFSFGEDGYSAVQIMRAGRPRFAGELMREASGAELQAAASSYLAFWGRYEVNEAGGYVAIMPEGSLFPNWTWAEQRRQIKFEQDGQRLELSYPQAGADGREYVSVVRWRRA